MKYLVTYTVKVEADSEEHARTKGYDEMFVWSNYDTVDVQLVDDSDKLSKELNKKLPHRIITLTNS